MATPATFSIEFGDLASIRLHERLPLEQLRPGDHVHGRLTIRIGNQELPYLGYSGPHDVCFAQWYRELDAVRSAFVNVAATCHTFDEGEEGQPAFIFEREGARAYVTIADSDISSGVADPDWQRVEFLADDLIREVDRFRVAFVQRLQSSSAEADRWIAMHCAPA